MCLIGAYLGRVAHDDALGVDLGGVLAALRGKARDRGIATLYGRMGVPGARSGLYVGVRVWEVKRETTRAGNENRRKGCERSRFVLGGLAQRYPGTPEGKLKPKPFPKAKFHPKGSYPNFSRPQKHPLEFFVLHLNLEWEPSHREERPWQTVS